MKNNMQLSRWSLGAPEDAKPRRRGRTRSAKSIAMVIVLSLFISMFAGEHRRSEAYPAPNLYLEGRGYGHGRGMGQFGALGYSLIGWPYASILNHFYGGTTSGGIGNPQMSVVLTRFDDQNTILANSAGGLTTGAGPGTFFALRVIRVGANQFRVEYANDCGGPWTVLNSSVGGPVTVWPPAYTDSLDDMIQACEPDGARRWIRGLVRVVDAGSIPRTVNDLPMDDYLKGVVPRESPASWADLGGGKGFEALKSQAVAARSYASTENKWSYAKTCDTTICQVYGGRAELRNGTFKDKEDSRTNSAVAQTTGEVRILQGSVARTEFSSSTGGWTAGGTFPAVQDDGDSVSYNSNNLWEKTLAVGAIESSWPAIGHLVSISVTSRNGLGDWGGRVQQVSIAGTAGTVLVSGGSFRSKMALKSDWFRFLGGWSTWAGLGGPVTSGPEAASWEPERLDLFARGTDNSLRHKWRNFGVWEGWESLGGDLTSDPAVVSWGNNRIDVFVRGTDNSLWHKWWDGSWSHWESLGGTLTSGPAVASWSPGRLDVFARGTDNGLWHKWWDGRRWWEWEHLGGTLTSAPASVSWGYNRIDLFARGTDNGLWHKWWDGKMWLGWEYLGGTLTSGPAAASWGPGRLDLFVRGTDNAAWHKQYQGGWSGWFSLGGELTSDPGSVSPRPGRIETFVKGTNEGIWTRIFADPGLS